MAVFNPTPAPGQDMMPNWTNVTRPISQPEADKSAGIMLNSAATGVEGAATLAENTAKAVIGEDVRKTVEKSRTDWTSTLQSTRNAQQNGQNPDTNNILPANAQYTAGGTPPPPAVDNGIDKIDGIQAAYSNGKINDTYYHQRLMSDVTALRQRYPGFTDYIDAKVSSITGVNPANAYAQDLMQDIARAQVNKKTEVDKAMDTVMKSGYPGSDKVMQALRERGESFIPAYREWYATNTELDAGLKRQEALRQNFKGKTEDYKTTREADWTNEVGTVVGNNFNTVLKVTGIDNQTATQILKEASENPGKYNEQQMKEFATKIIAQKAVVFSQLDQRAAALAKDSSGRSYSYNSDIGAAKVQEIKTQVGQYYDQIYKALWDGGPSGAGVAFARMQQANGMLADTKAKIYNSPVGEDLRTFNILNTDMGPNWTAAITDKALRARVDDAIRPLFTTESNKARSQPDLKPDGSGVPFTFKDMSGKVLDLENNKKITSAMRSRYLNEGLKIVEDISDKDAPIPAKINAVKFFFSPQGQNILPTFKDDYYDTAKGVNVPGRQTMWNKLTSEDVVKNIAQLSKADPEIGKMYKNWVETEAGSHLYYKELQNLNQITGHDDLHIKYNDGGKGGVPQIELIDRDGKPIVARANIPGTYSTSAPSQDRTSPYINNVLGSITKLNTALAGMDRVEKGFNGNSSDQLLSFLVHSQVDLGKNWEGLPAKLMDAIAASRGRGKLKELMEGTK